MEISSVTFRRRAEKSLQLESAEIRKVRMASERLKQTPDIFCVKYKILLKRNRQSLFIKCDNVNVHLN